MFNYHEVFPTKEKEPTIGDRVNVPVYGGGEVVKVEPVKKEDGTEYNVYHVKLGEEVRHFTTESV